MRRIITLSVVLLLVGFGCRSKTASNESNSNDQAGNTSNSSSTTTPKKSAATSDNGVYRHSVWLARSADGKSWTLDDAALIEHASVPNITRFETAVGDYPAGTLMIVYVDASTLADASNGTERTGRYVSTDNGKSWTNAGAVTYVGADGQVPVDPNLIQLPDGRLRMYYFDFSQIVGGVILNESGAKSHFYAADSTDGKTFTVVGEVFSDKQLTDPEVIYDDGVYTLFFARQGDGPSTIKAATSTDGLNFTEVEVTNSPEGIPGAIAVDGGIMLYGCGSEGIIRAFAEDGLVFGASTSVGTFTRGACDPDPVQLADGSFILVIKKAPVMTAAPR